LKSKTYIIAEIGVNHNGDTALAKEMVTAAKRAGADAVKFQTFSAERLASAHTPKVAYQKRTTGTEDSHQAMLAKLELSESQHVELKAYCDSLDIDFLSTPYDVQSARFLYESLGLTTFKVASADIVDLPLHKYLAEHATWSIVSTGMASLGEIERALACYRDVKNGNQAKVTLLQCVSNYPCGDESLNLATLQTLKTAFQVDVGYSDHAIGNVAAIMAVALGGCVLEKHFTLDKDLPGPDHQASIDEAELASFVTDIRRAEQMIGTGIKMPQPEELEMRSVSRKSIFMTRAVAKGECLTEGHFTLKRPGTGLAPYILEEAVGSYAARDLNAGDMLRPGDFCYELN